MEIIEISPHSGAGRIKLNMSKGEVRKIMGVESYYDISSNSDYFFHFIIIHYDENDKVNLIELMRDIDIMKEHHVMYEGVNVFTTLAEDLIRHVQKFDTTLPEETDYSKIFTYTSHVLDMSLYRSMICEEKNLLDPAFFELDQETKDDYLKFKYFEIVAIGVKGYYCGISKGSSI